MIAQTVNQHNNLFKHDVLETAYAYLLFMRNADIACHYLNEVYNASKMH
jgi:hypothetical protein